LGTTAINLGGNGKLATGEILLNPYRGLRAFQESDANYFFGRESLVRRLLARLWENEAYNRFLAVVGPSGSGKSSVVQAGLVPALRQGALPNSEKWFYAEFVPGAQPMEELANVVKSLASTPISDVLEQIEADEKAFGNLLNQVLPDATSEVFLLIDQFEEVFTLNTDERQAGKFIHALFHALTSEKSRLRLVVTIRADFYDRPLLTPRIADLVRERTEVVVPLSVSELERVIVEPARRVGVEFDSALVASIVAEVQEQPGALPLLQYALTELFEKREGNLITPNAYKAIGGVRGALARRADELHDRFDESHQEAMRQLFLRLITLGEGTEDTRRRALLSEVMSVADKSMRDGIIVMDNVVNTLGRARLLTFDRDPITRSPTLEVTHEAIIREWTKLRHWLDDSRADVRLQRALGSLSQEWESSNHDPSFLLRGVRLQQYERWLQSSDIALTQQERTYIDASLAARAQLQRQQEEQAARERRLELRTISLLRLVVAGLALIVVGAVVLTGVALNERQRAEQSALVAQQNAADSRSIALASNAQTLLGNDDGDLALLLALEANALPNPPIEARSSLAQVAVARGTSKRLIGSEAANTSVAISADGRFVAAGSTDAVVRVWDANTSELVYTLAGHGGDVESVAFSADGAWLVSSASDFTAILWDMSDGTEERRFEGHTGTIRQALFAPDGQTLLTASGDGLVLVWDVATGAQTASFAEHGASVLAMALSSDGRYVLSGSRDGRVLYWELATGTVIHNLSSAEGSINDVDISADGTRALIAKGGGGLSLWDLTTGAFVRSFIGATEEVQTAEFTPDGQHIISGTLDGTMLYWSVETGLVVDRMLGHRGEVFAVTVSADGRTAGSASADTSVRLWNIAQPGDIGRVQAHSERITDVEVGESKTRYTVSVDGVLRVADATSVRDIPYTDVSLMSLAVNSNETTALLGTREGAVFLVGLSDGVVSQTLSGHTSSVLHVAFLADEALAISSSQSGEVILWNLTEGREVRRYEMDDDGAVYDFALLNNGAALAVGGDNVVYLFDVATGERLGVLTGHTSSIYSVVASPDGSRLVTGARDGVVIVWDVARQAEQTRYVVEGSAVWSVAFNPQGDKLAAGGSSGLLLVWDVATGDELQRFSAEDTVFSLDFTPNSVLSGLGNGVLSEWVVFNGDEAVVWARTHRYIRELDCFERERYRMETACGQ
jgi:WD40 repeat protein